MDTYHLTFDDGRWILTREGGIEAVAEYTTRTEAELHCGEMLRKRGGVLVIHKLDGSIDEERTIGQSGSWEDMALTSPVVAGEIEESRKEDSMPGLRPYTFE